MDAKEITIILIRTTNVPYSVEAIIGNILAHICTYYWDLGFANCYLKSENFWYYLIICEVILKEMISQFLKKNLRFWKLPLIEHSELKKDDENIVFGNILMIDIAKLKKITNKKPSLNYVQSISKMDFIHFSL